MPKHVCVGYSASLSNSILANYQSDFWKARAEYWFSIMVFIANAFPYWIPLNVCDTLCL